MGPLDDLITGCMVYLIGLGILIGLVVGGLIGLVCLVVF